LQESFPRPLRQAQGFQRSRPQSSGACEGAKRFGVRGARAALSLGHETQQGSGHRPAPAGSKPNESGALTHRTPRRKAWLIVEEGCGYAGRMSEAEQRERSHAGSWVMWGVFALMIYVFSMAPMEALAWNQKWFRLLEFDRCLHAPLRQVLRSSPSLTKVYSRYRSRWDELLPCPVGVF
jgi:hypothetical protein